MRKLNKWLEKISPRVVAWVGSPSSVVVHTLAFMVVVALRIWISTDAMLLVLTTLVSLEAIYLAIFNQMTLNGHTGRLTEIHEDVEEALEEENETHGI